MTNRPGRATLGRRALTPYLEPNLYSGTIPGLQRPSRRVRPLNPKSGDGSALQKFSDLAGDPFWMRLPEAVVPMGIKQLPNVSEADPKKFRHGRPIGPATIGRPIATPAIVAFQAETLRLEPGILCRGKADGATFAVGVPTGESQTVRGKLIQKRRQLKQTFLSRRLMDRNIVSCPLFHATP